MPGFGRHKHSNRSSNAIDSLAAGAPAITTATRATPGATPVNQGGEAYAQVQPQPSQHSHSNSPATTATPISALSSSSHPTGFSSSESFETRPHQPQLPQQQQLQQHQQQQQPPPPQQILYSDAHVADDNLPPLQQGPGAGPGPGEPPAYEPRRLQKASRAEYADAPVGRSQSQRYSTILPSSPILQSHANQQHQQPYGAITSSSVDDLPGTAAHPPTVAVSFPERRSARKLIKGLFGGGSSRNSATPPDQQPEPQQLQQHQLQQQQQQQQQQHGNFYDNTSGLARRPSKRAANNPPLIKTQLSQPSDHDWHDQDKSSPLHGVDETDEYHYSAHDSNRDLVSQDSRNPLNTTIRQVSGDVETSPYDDAVYAAPPHPPPHLHQPSHSQDHQLRYDQATYEQQTVPSPPSLQQFPYGNPQQGHYQHSGDPRLVNTHLGLLAQQHQQPPNPETLSQVSHESPVTDSDQRSTNQQSAQTSPAAQNSTAAIQDLAHSPPPVQTGNTQPQQPMMAPPTGGPPPNRRAQEATDKALRGQAGQADQVPIGSGPPPGYRGSTASMGSMPLSAAPVQGQPQTPSYRGQGTPQFDGPPGEQGRNSPQPPTQDPAEADKAFKDLLLKYKNVKRLYFDGKSQIEQLTAQVEHLQNAVANQRMSQSRTALDDSEYSTRFSRLNGAINNLSFNIRKDWQTVPQWLEQYVSIDALKTGKQEMTAIGRAVVSRWLVEELFDKCFHPGLEPVLSAQLKEIELSIRGNSYTLHSQEEFDALTAKIVNWRMATLDGLKSTLDPATSAQNRSDLTSKATSNLTACLYQYMGTPPPSGVEGSTSMIVELAVAIAANLPLESRDVALMYPLPGDKVQPHLMEVEKAGLPVLESQKSEGSAEADDDSDRDKNGKTRGDKAKTGMLNAMLGGAPQQGRKGSVASSIGQSSTDVDNLPALPKDTGIVRFAGFMALEVRGRQVLMKAPVWTL